MSGEAEAIQRHPDGPVSRASILRGLASLGVVRGDRLLVHASLSALGFVAGGAEAVVGALRHAVGEEGLLVMPAFSSQLSDPRHWRAPPVPEAWWPAIRRETPPFDPATTPSRGIGAVAELLRTTRNAVRGPHPQLSFTAWGAGAEEVVAPHTLSDGLGEGSPLGRLYQLGAKVVFLGTGYGTCTAFHLAEHRAGCVSFRPDGAPMVVAGQARWVEFEAPTYGTESFEALGQDFEAGGEVTVGRIGAATSRAFRLRAAVDFAEDRMGADR